MPTARATVAVLKTSPATVLDDVQRLVDLGGIEDALDAHAPTVLKDNLSWHLPFPAANTTPWQLEATVLALRRRGLGRLSLLRNETPATDGRRAAAASHHDGVCAAHGVPVDEGFGPGARRTSIRPRARLRVLHHVFPGGVPVPASIVGANLVHLPTMKTHVYTTVAGAMENALAGLLGPAVDRAAPSMSEALVDLLAIQREVCAGLFAIMDGTTAGNGPGPRTMYPVIKDYMLASADPVALDAVAAAMMGFDPMEIDYLRMADEAGLGCARLDEIAIAGVDVTHESWGFSVGQNVARRIADLLWFGRLNRYQRLIATAPIRRALAFGSEVYYDHLRWPLHDRGKYEVWRRDTAWGRLFTRYASGPLAPPRGRPTPRPTMSA